MAITDINLKLPSLAEQKHNHDYNCATKPPTNQIGWKFNSLYPIKMFHIHPTFILTTNYMADSNFNCPWKKNYKRHFIVLLYVFIYCLYIKV